jgi:hypothetical protein
VYVALVHLLLYYTSWNNRVSRLKQQNVYVALVHLLLYYTYWNNRVSRLKPQKYVCGPCTSAALLYILVIPTGVIKQQMYKGHIHIFVVLT